ncbi:(2Fe-2S) ferredoxin domain-containing protein [Lusitaniella coriacea]|uniref:(2Fe-2S) ferredoxin domain-containing protein n=1 Tax=Lusitaniella coriacea TaxID=1983105 RepID=UPI003CEB4825
MKTNISEFQFFGQLLDFVIKDGYKIKYLRLAVAEREYWIKPNKELRKNLDPKIVPGCWLAVSGIRKVSKKTGKTKLKADFIELAEVLNSSDSIASSPQVSDKTPPKVKILVCQKSDCRKRGGRAVCQAIEDNLRDRGLRDRVAIKTTGCLKQCKKGPNLVVMPDKARYSKISPQEIPALIEKHVMAQSVG